MKTASEVTSVKSKRKRHPEVFGSKRSQRRRRAIDRANYLADKEALILGAHAVTFEAAMSVALRAAFGHPHGTDAPDEGLLWARVEGALEWHVSRSVRDEYREMIEINITDACEQALALQEVRHLMRRVRELRRMNAEMHGVGKYCREIGKILTELDRPIPDEFKIEAVPAARAAHTITVRAPRKGRR
jgi:hypothetical protein